jgi:hypothetical protein
MLRFAGLLHKEELDIMSTIGYRPPYLSEADLRALLKDALENGNGPENPETFHARYDHVERGLTLDDVILVSSTTGHMNVPLNSTKANGNGNIG